MRIVKVMAVVQEQTGLARLARTMMEIGQDFFRPPRSFNLQVRSNSTTE